MACFLTASLSQYWYLHCSRGLDWKPWNEAFLIILFLNFSVNSVELTFQTHPDHDHFSSLPYHLALAIPIFPGQMDSTSALVPSQSVFHTRAPGVWLRLFLCSVSQDEACECYSPVLISLLWPEPLPRLLTLLHNGHPCCSLNMLELLLLQSLQTQCSFCVEHAFL